MVTRSRHVAALVCGSEIATSHCNIVCNYLLALRSIKKLPAPRILERIIDPYSLYTCIYIYHPLHIYIFIYFILCVHIYRYTSSSSDHQPASEPARSMQVSI